VARVNGWKTVRCFATVIYRGKRVGHAIRYDAHTRVLRIVGSHTKKQPQVITYGCGLAGENVLTYTRGSCEILILFCDSFRMPPH
jgi:hypothetical protein